MNNERERKAYEEVRNYLNIIGSDNRVKIIYEYINNGFNKENFYISFANFYKKYNLNKDIKSFYDMSNVIDKYIYFCYLNQVSS